MLVGVIQGPAQPEQGCYPVCVKQWAVTQKQVDPEGSGVGAGRDAETSTCGISKNH